MASTFINLPAIKHDVDVRDLNPNQDTVGVGDTDGHTLDVNPDGSINVVVSDNIFENAVNKYGEVSSVASATETTVVTHTAVPVVDTYLQRVTVSGTNIAEYRIKINAVVVEKVRTYFSGSLNEELNFTGTSNRGYKLTIGDIVTVTVVHNRPQAGDFNSRIQLIEVS